MKTGSIIAKTAFALIITHLCAVASINTNGEKGVLRTLSAETMGQAKLNIMVGAGYAQETGFVRGWRIGDSLVNAPQYNDANQIGIQDPARMLSSNLSAGIGVFSFWDFALSLPFYYDWAGFEGLNEGGLGDLEISTKIRVPRIGKVFWQGYYFAMTLQTGMRTGLFPRHPYYYELTAAALDPNPARHFYSYDKPTFKGLALWTFDFSDTKAKFPLSINVNVGAVLTAESDMRNSAVGGLAIDYTPVSFLTLFADAWAESRWSSFVAGVDISRDPIFISPGMKVTTPGGLYLLFAGDFCMSSRLLSARNNWERDNYQYSTTGWPLWGMQFQFGWNGFLTVQDDDRDGIKNDDDRCPKDAEDIDGFEDSDGCPDVDNDRDGIDDAKDKCPNEAEDTDGFEDEDGCPDHDNDGDGITDTKDQCPNLPEDFDGFEDKDGCPDTDNDRDGVPDSLDKCPNDPEDFDKFQDEDGCPDIDNDNDGIPDLKDKCPDQPETFNSLDDEDGCPDTVVQKKEVKFPKQQIVAGVSFKSGSADLTFESYHLFEPILKTLKDNPEIEIEIRGHTDAVGGYTNNMRLSQLRAESVRQYLINQGVAGERIRAVGFGSSAPIADNCTATGRTVNRRIEIIRTK